MIGSTDRKVVVTEKKAKNRVNLEKEEKAKNHVKIKEEQKDVNCGEIAPHAIIEKYYLV